MPSLAQLPVSTLTRLPQVSGWAPAGHREKTPNTDRTAQRLGAQRNRAADTRVGGESRSRWRKSRPICPPLPASDRGAADWPEGSDGPTGERAVPDGADPALPEVPAVGQRLHHPEEVRRAHAADPQEGRARGLRAGGEQVPAACHGRQAQDQHGGELQRNE